MDDIEVSLKDRLGDFDLDVSFTVPAQGVTALFGRSGSGKTTVLRAVAGLIHTAGGRVRINGETWQDDKHFLPAHRRPLGYVFQEASLFAHLSVLKNLQYGWRRVPAAQRKVKLDSVIELLGIAPLLKRAPHSMSGGERQRVAIARALITSPKLLLMDEPLSAMDHDAKQAILPYLDTLHNELAIPSIYVSHDPNEVARLADQMVLLDKGRVVATGMASDLLTRLDLPLSGFDNASSLLEGTVSAHDSEYHLTWITLQQVRVAVSREDLPIGRPARIEILAKDVSLSLKAHSDTSIINILPVRVMDMREITPSQVIVRLQLADGQSLLSRITLRSARSLELQKDMTLFAQVKAVALV